MMPWLREHFGNPASRSHAWGWEAEEAVEKARAQVAALIGADPREIVWTSGATESNNLAIKGAAQFYQSAASTSSRSRPSTRPCSTPCASWSARASRSPTSTCRKTACSTWTCSRRAAPDTILVSVMLVNNEIGVIQDIPAIGALCRERGIIFHVDAAQATGKVAIDLATLPVDLMSLASHKTYGPKGIGALYVRRKPRVRIEAQMHGGGHERGMRSGTLPTHQIVGMGEAFRIAQARRWAPRTSASACCATACWPGCRHRAECFINGDLERRVPHNLNISFNFVEGESLIMGIKGIAVSSGSACTSASLEPSYVLRALGRSDELAHSSPAHDHRPLHHRREIDYAVATGQDRWPSCASCRPCGTCTRTASTSAPSSGRRTERPEEHLDSTQE
jgi:cysteine desulfurase